MFAHCYIFAKFHYILVLDAAEARRQAARVAAAVVAIATGQL